MKTELGLRDIQGIDQLHIWPLAIGWWILLALLTLFILVTWYLRARNLAKIRSWQYQTLKRFELLEKNLSDENSQKTAIETELLMRRLVLQKYPRVECAALKGEEWLLWLSQKDPKQFNWSESGRFLIEAPFCPSPQRFDLEPIRKTIRASKGWVN